MPANSPTTRAPDAEVPATSIEERLANIEATLADLTAAIRDAAREDTAAWLAVLGAVNKLEETTIPEHVEQFARVVVQALRAERRKGPQDALEEHAAELRTLGAKALPVALRNAIGALRWDVHVLGAEHVAATLVEAATARGFITEPDAITVVRDALAHVPKRGPR